jgi:hypothetical protein
LEEVGGRMVAWNMCRFIEELIGSIA